VRIYSAHTGKMARPVPIWNSLRPSCTIGSSCYRYIALLPKSFGVKTASLLTCDPGFQHEFPRPRPTFSQMHCNGALSGKRYPVFGRGLSRTAPGEWLENLCSFIPGSVPNFGPRPGITRLQMRMNLCFRRKASRAKADFSFRPKIGRYQAKKRRFLPRRHYISEEKKSLLVFTAFLCFFIVCFTTYGFCSIRLFPLLAPFEESRLRNAELFSSCAGA